MIETDKLEVLRLRDSIERAIAYGVGDDALIVLCKALGKQLNPQKVKKND